LIVDPSGNVLLVKHKFPSNGWTGWLLPGGGLEDGESLHEGLLRELAEEIGASSLSVGPKVLHQTHICKLTYSSKYDGQEEHVFLVNCHKFELAPAMSAEELRAEGIIETRWWTVPEIESSDEIIKPENLAVLVTQVLDAGAPDAPIVLEINEQ